MEWNNADSYESWKKLMSLKGQVSLKKELNAERVKKYSHGLVLDKIDPSKNLMQIIQFAKSCKETP